MLSYSQQRFIAERFKNSVSYITLPESNYFNIHTIEILAFIRLNDKPEIIIDAKSIKKPCNKYQKINTMKHQKNLFFKFFFCCNYIRWNGYLWENLYAGQKMNLKDDGLRNRVQNFVKRILKDFKLTEAFLLA